MMQFGLFDHMDRGPASLAEDYEHRLCLAEAGEALGFTRFHTTEHHGTPLSVAPSPSLFFAAMAQRTRRLRFGPLVYTLPLYNPLRLAEEIAMLDQMSGGRLELGVGRGVSPHELRFHGLDPAESQARYEESLRLILLVLRSAGQEVSFQGRYYSADAVPIILAPVQLPHPPLWYGIAKLEALPWLAQHGVNLVSSNAAAAMRMITDGYREIWAADGPMPLLGINRHTVVADSDAQALAIGRRAYAAWHRNFTFVWRQKGGAPHTMMFPEDFDALLAQGKALCGSPATVRAQLGAQLRESGCNYMLARFAFGDMRQEESLAAQHLFGREVMGEFANLPAAAVPMPAMAG